MEQITSIEQSQLKEYEVVIERGLKTFVNVGLALMAIRDKGLYRHDYGTFEDYCRERWGMARRTAYQLIDAVEVVENVRNCAQILPANEAQARPLTALEPEQQREAWAQAVETAPDGKITGAHVQSVVDQITGNSHDTMRTFESDMAFSPPITEQRQPAQKNPALYTSDSVEWYTPDDIVTRVVEVLGVVDVDPCSNSGGKPRIPAKKHYTVADDGLSQNWKGKVYMNPPYGREIADWINYLVEQYQCGNTTEAIALVPSRTDTEWFRKLRDYPRCFVWGRLKFSDNDNSAPFPSMLVYLGSNVGDFLEAFSDVGDTYLRVQRTME